MKYMKLYKNLNKSNINKYMNHSSSFSQAWIICSTIKLNPIHAVLNSKHFGIEHVWCNNRNLVAISGILVDRIDKSCTKHNELRTRIPKIFPNNWDKANYNNDNMSNIARFHHAQTLLRKVQNIRTITRRTNLIGALHLRGLPSLRKIGCEAEPALGVLNDTAYLPPSLERVLRRVLRKHAAEVLI